MTCDKICQRDNSPCKQEECDNFINYEPDLNCVLICARTNGPLTLQETAKRLGVSYVRIKQIEDKALIKIKDYLKEEEKLNSN